MHSTTQQDGEPATQQDKDTPTVFLVDDEADIRATLSRALNKRGLRVQPFDSAADFLAKYDTTQPGCLVLDYGLPEMNGLELQRALAERNIPIPIIFISGHGGIPETVQAMKSGAVDFLEKPFRQHTLIECIETAFATDQANRAQETSRHNAQAKFETLTTREKEIAEFMISNPSNTASKEIGRRLDISPRTVDHHRARILEKMDIKSVAELIEVSVLISGAKAN